MVHIASDDAAKTMWKRKNGGSMELPFILVDGVNPGTVEQLEEAWVQY
jgi:glutaredoxin